MKKIFKKNQVIVTVMAILIIAAGYLKYTNDNADEISKEAAESIYETTYLGDDLLNSEVIASLDEDNETEAGDNETTVNNSESETTNENETNQPGEAILTNSTITDFIINSKIEREQLRSKNKESLLDIINNENATDEQKKSAVDAMVTLTNNSETENTIETLLEAKGLENIIVTISDNQVDVIVDESQITDENRAKIEETIKRKTKFSADKIVITPARN